MSDNKRTKVTYEFDLADLPMIAQAFLISGNTQMMCGHGAAKNRMYELMQQIEEKIPAGARIFDDGAWFEIVTALYSAKTWSVGITVPDYRKNSFWVRGHITVSVDGKSWRTTEMGYEKGAKEIDQVREALQALAPLSALETSLEIPTK